MRRTDRTEEAPGRQRRPVRAPTTYADGRRAALIRFGAGGRSADLLDLRQRQSESKDIRERWEREARSLGNRCFETSTVS